MRIILGSSRDLWSGALGTGLRAEKIAAIQHQANAAEFEIPSVNDYDVATEAP
jgi:hypothetical protein